VPSDLSRAAAARHSAREDAPGTRFSQDESRFGLLTVHRRCLTARGVQPVGSVQQDFEWFYVYAAIASMTGERLFLERVMHFWLTMIHWRYGT
jgi:hypothetical protein